MSQSVSPRGSLTAQQTGTDCLHSQGGSQPKGGLRIIGRGIWLQSWMPSWKDAALLRVAANSPIKDGLLWANPRWAFRSVGACRFSSKASLPLLKLAQCHTIISLQPPLLQHRFGAFWSTMAQEKPIGTAWCITYTPVQTAIATDIQWRRIQNWPYLT